MNKPKKINRSLAVRSKVWLEIKGKPVMGEGRMDMLEAIQRYGSILQASKATGVSYRKIRGAIHDMEGALGIAMVRSYRGGGQGGGHGIFNGGHECVGDGPAPDLGDVPGGRRGSENPYG